MSGTIDRVITALRDLFDAAQVPRLVVWDGPNWKPPSLCLEVGWDREQGFGATLTRESDDYGMTQYDEVVIVDCLVSCHTGANVGASARRIVADAFDQLDDQLKANPATDVWSQAFINEVSYTPDRNEGGALASMRFTVTCRVL